MECYAPLSMGCEDVILEKSSLNVDSSRGCAQWAGRALENVRCDDENGIDQRPFFICFFH